MSESKPKATDIPATANVTSVKRPEGEIPKDYQPETNIVTSNVKRSKRRVNPMKVIVDAVKELQKPWPIIKTIDKARKKQKKQGN